MQRRPEHGFSLIEALVATALFGIIMVGVFTLYASNSSVFKRSAGKAESQQNARIAIDRLSRELRMAGYDLSGVIAGLANPTGVQTGEATRLAFVADLDGDGVLEQVTYDLSSGRIRRETRVWNGVGFGSASTSVLADGVTALSFTYFDDAAVNAPIAAPVAASNLDDIKRITIAVATESSFADQSATFPLALDVRLRN